MEPEVLLEVTDGIIEIADQDCDVLLAPRSWASR
jgi:hypothetical protein